MNSATPYREAIEDARTAGADDIYRNMVAITEYDDRITWEGEPGSSAILVATWTDATFASLEMSGQLLLSEETWVTLPLNCKASAQLFINLATDFPSGWRNL